MKQIKQILIGSLLGLGILLSTNLYSAQGDAPKAEQQKEKSKEKEESKSKEDKEEEKKSGSRTRTYKPPKKDK